MQEKPRMNGGQIVTVSFIIGVAGFLTYAAIFFIGAGIAESDRRPALEIGGVVVILAMAGSLCVCFLSLWDRSSAEEVRDVSSNRPVPNWGSILKRAIKVGVGAFVFFTGVLIVAGIPVTSSLLSGIVIGFTWGVATILIYLVWPVGLHHNR